MLRSLLPPLDDRGAWFAAHWPLLTIPSLTLEGEAYTPLASPTNQLPVSPACLERIAFQIQRDVPSRLTLKTRKWPSAVQLLQWQYHPSKGITDHLEAGHTTYRLYVVVRLPSDQYTPEPATNPPRRQFLPLGSSCHPLNGFVLWHEEL
jgi:hypothetical protein